MLDALAITEQKTLRRHNARQDRVAASQGYGGTIGGVRITEACLPSLSRTISEELEWPHYGIRAFAYVTKTLDRDVIAATVLRSLLHSIAMGTTLRGACDHIAGAVRAEAWAAGLLQKDPRLHARIKRAVSLRHADVAYRQQAARGIAARIAGYKGTEWSKRDRIVAGGFLLNCVLKCLGHMFVIEKHEGEHYPQVTQEALGLAERAVEECLRRNPAWIPCVEPPKPWTRLSDGGYWDERTRLSAQVVRAYHKDRVAAIKAAMVDGSMQPHIDGLNALQSVAWTINHRVLDVLKWTVENDVPVAGVPSAYVSAPPRLSDEEWKDENKRRLQRHRISQVKQHNRRLKCDRILFAEDMAIAEMLAPEQRFYTPQNLDWRGRVYSLTHFAFPRDDRVRALFLFAEGLPIGEEGLYWLKVHCANVGDFGKVSKRPFAERVAWVDERLDAIMDIAQNPHSTAVLRQPGRHIQEDLRWTKADKPFLFLAACMELSSALAAGTSFLTKLPVSFDGSCSGLQHLCAMTRAEEGALVNLTPQEVPQDVYQTVAALVQDRVQQDALAGDGLAKRCLAYGITRSVVKRNVMTYSYSSKKFGMGRQQVEDLMRPLSIDVLAGALDEHPFGDDDGLAASKYLAAHVYDAIEQVVHRPAQAMTFLQKLARVLAHEGKPLSWTTPTGLPWINRYHESNVKRVELWLQDARVTVTTADGHKKEIAKDRAANGVAPNFVHALDAAHLILTVNACVREGITSLATVHDSFGCLAPQAGRFRDIIREQFVEMYETHDVLAEALACAKRDLTVHNWDRLPAIPARGTLNLKEVLNAEYAFA